MTGDEAVRPACATLTPANEDNEKQTVLLLGAFQTADGGEPTEVEIRDVTFTVNGSRVELEKDDGFSVDLGAPTATIAVSRSQTLADFAVLDLTADGNTADDDENGCAATFPASTYAVRLIFSSGVRDRDADGALVPLGSDPSAARANELFSLRAASGGPSTDRIIGQADADGDNYADVCVQGSGAARDAVALVVACEAGAAVIAPDGTPCTAPIEVQLEGQITTMAAPPATAPAPAESAAPSPVQAPPDSSRAAAPPLRHVPWYAAAACTALLGLLL